MSMRNSSLQIQRNKNIYTGIFRLFHQVEREIDFLLVSPFTPIEELDKIQNVYNQIIFARQLLEK